jgi:hypothetical protein
MTTTLTVLSDHGLLALLALYVVCVAGCGLLLGHEFAVLRARADERVKVHAESCALGLHEITIDTGSARITARCRWCPYRSELGIAFSTGSNRKRRRPA